MARSSSSVYALPRSCQGINVGSTRRPDGSLPVRKKRTKSPSGQVGTIARRLGPAGGPKPPGVPPPRFAPWHVRHPVMSTRYWPYSRVAPAGGGGAGGVVFGCFGGGKRGRE